MRANRSTHSDTLVWLPALGRKQTATKVCNRPEAYGRKRQRHAFCDSAPSVGDKRRYQLDHHRPIEKRK